MNSIETLKNLGWTENIHNEEDGIYEFQKGDRYISIDDDYIDLYTYIGGEYRCTYLTPDELFALYEFVRETNNER